MVVYLVGISVRVITPHLRPRHSEGYLWGGQSALELAPGKVTLSGCQGNSVAPFLEGGGGDGGGGGDSHPSWGGGEGGRVTTIQSGVHI